MAGQTIKVPRFNVLEESNFEPLPEYNGHQAVLYESAEVKAGSFKEHGRFEDLREFDEFIYVVAGSSEVTVEGAEPFVMKAGDCCYLRKGWKVSVVHDDEFHDVAVLIHDVPPA